MIVITTSSQYRLDICAPINRARAISKICLFIRLTILFCYGVLVQEFYVEDHDSGSKHEILYLHILQHCQNEEFKF